MKNDLSQTSFNCPSRLSISMILQNFSPIGFFFTMLWSTECRLSNFTQITQWKMTSTQSDVSSLCYDLLSSFLSNFTQIAQWKMTSEPNQFLKPKWLIYHGEYWDLELLLQRFMANALHVNCTCCKQITVCFIQSHKQT